MGGECTPLSSIADFELFKGTTRVSDRRIKKEHASREFLYIAELWVFLLSLLLRIWKSTPKSESAD